MDLSITRRASRYELQARFNAEEFQHLFNGSAKPEDEPRLGFFGDAINGIEIFPTKATDRSTHKVKPIPGLRGSAKGFVAVVYFRPETHGVKPDYRPALKIKPVLGKGRIVIPHIAENWHAPDIKKIAEANKGKVRIEAAPEPEVIEAPSAEPTPPPQPPPVEIRKQAPETPRPAPINDHVYPTSRHSVPPAPQRPHSGSATFNPVIPTDAGVEVIQAALQAQSDQARQQHARGPAPQPQASQAPLFYVPPKSPLSHEPMFANDIRSQDEAFRKIMELADTFNRTVAMAGELKIEVAPDNRILIWRAYRPGQVKLTER